MKATTRKAIADVTRRKGRAILVTPGIMIGVLGLTAVNIASSAITTVFAYSNDQSKSSHIQFTVQSLNPDASAQTLVSGLLSAMNVSALVAVVLTCFLIINTISTLVAGQTKILNAMIAIGVTRLSVVRGYLTSICLYGFWSSTLGTILGIVMGLVSNLYCNNCNSGSSLIPDSLRYCDQQ